MPKASSAAERHGDQDRHREGIAQRGARLALQERAQPAGASAHAVAARSRRDASRIVAAEHGTAVVAGAGAAAATGVSRALAGAP